MKELLDTIRETRQEQLTETNQIFGHIEQLVRMGLMPVNQLHHLKRAMTHMESGNFMPTLERRAFYQFVGSLMELTMTDPALLRLVKNKVSAKAGMKESVENLDEAKTKTPIPDHPYHKKDDSQLKYILKDASRAAKAMQGHDPEAEKKYLDQANDASTILGHRRRSSKVVGESVLDEGNKENKAKKNAHADSLSNTGQREDGRLVVKKAAGMGRPPLEDVVKSNADAKASFGARVKRGLMRDRVFNPNRLDGFTLAVSKSNPSVKEETEHLEEGQKLSFRSMSDAALSAMANTVFRKRRSGGIPTDADRQIASKAKAELRRRRNTKNESYADSLASALTHFGISSVAELTEAQSTEFFQYIDTLESRGEQ